MRGWRQCRYCHEIRDRARQHQPFTPIIDTIRGLLAGAVNASEAMWAIGWLLATADRLLAAIPMFLATGSR